MTPASSHGSVSISALIVYQWLPAWEAVKWNPALRQSRPDRKQFYLFSLPARLLKRLSGIQRRSIADSQPRAKDIGIQRYHDEERSKLIKEFVQYGYPWSELSESKRSSPEFADLRKPGWLPTAIIVNIPSAGAERRKLKLDASDAIQVQDRNDKKSAILSLPKRLSDADWSPKGLHPIEIIDGQHRLWAFEEGSDGDMEVPVVAFYNLDISWQAYLFWTINIKPKRINASLAFDLYPLLRSEEWLNKFAGHPVYRETRAQELVEALWSHPDSPWFHRINMLGESVKQSKDPRPMVSQSAWVRALLATYVKSWEGPGTRVGGLFGSEKDGHEPRLQWTRTQQAAFLLHVWMELAAAVRKTKGEWATALRKQDRLARLAADEDLAFFGNGSLFTTDPGIRGVLNISNDLCWVRSEELELSDWRAPDEATATDQKAVSKALESFKRRNAADFIMLMASSLAKFDWRTSTAPGLTAAQERDKRALRGSGGYLQLRRDLVALLAQEKGDVGSAASRVKELLGYK